MKNKDKDKEKSKERKREKREIEKVEDRGTPMAGNPYGAGVNKCQGRRAVSSKGE